MTTLREAAQQALEALESLFTLQADDARPKRCGDAITALRAALEKHAKDVEWMKQRHANWRKQKELAEKNAALEKMEEPVAWQWLDTGTFRKKLPKNAEHCAWTPLYTHPPRREWRGLTEEEILTEAARHLGEMHVENCGIGDIKDFASALEAALKERNA